MPLCGISGQTTGKAYMEYLYELSFLKDTTTTVKTHDLMMLRIGKTGSVFFSKHSYTLDSLLCSDQGAAMQMDILANGSAKYGKQIVSYAVFKDRTAKKIDYTDNVGGDHYRYEEPMPQMDWTIRNEYKTIWEYKCQKATCNFRGRTYEAWFTTEIPVSDGPWKFQGLPGLILEVYDTRHHYSFVYVGQNNSEADITVLPHTYIRTSRANYQKAVRNFLKDPVGYITGASGMTITLSDKKTKSVATRKVKYDLLERE